MNELKELSLFTGAGGGVLGTKLLGFRHIGYVEWNPYCQKVLQARIADGYLDAAPIFSDIRKFVSEGYAESYQGMVDVISAGWPCQPHSLAGRREGASSHKDMWEPTADAIRIIRPKYFFGENVPGMLTSDGGSYFGRVLGDLASMGYDAEWGVLSANSEGAPHLRERFWIVANASGGRFSESQDGEMEQPRRTEVIGSGIAAHAHAPQCQGERIPGGIREEDSRIGWPSEVMANANGFGQSGQRPHWYAFDPAETEEGETDRAFHERVGYIWGLESRMGRVVNGLANRVDRLEATGNGQVSSVARRAWQVLA